MRPILLNSCARAATAAEARFRIDAPIAPSRGARVVALDAAAITAVRRISTGPWATARFYATAGPGRLAPLDPDGPPWTGAEAGAPLDAELDGTDVAVLVATTAEAAAEAAAIGAACAARGLMTAGLVLDQGGADTLDAVAMLRPYARVLLVTAEDDDIAVILTALRA